MIKSCEILIFHIFFGDKKTEQLRTNPEKTFHPLPHRGAAPASSRSSTKRIGNSSSSELSQRVVAQRQLQDLTVAVRPRRLSRGLVWVFLTSPKVCFIRWHENDIYIYIFENDTHLSFFLGVWRMIQGKDYLMGLFHGDTFGIPMGFQPDVNGISIVQRILMGPKSAPKSSKTPGRYYNPQWPC